MTTEHNRRSSDLMAAQINILKYDNEQKDKRIAELEFQLHDSECKWVGFADENYQLKKQILDFKSLLAEAGAELIHSNRYAQSNGKEQLIAKIVEGYTPKISIF